jgi:hypothetical protein
MVTAGLVLAAAAAPARAADRTFSWHGEVTAVAGTAATVRVVLSDAALKAIGRTPGAALTLVWAAEGDMVVYAPAAADLTAVGYGFLTDAELVSVDEAAKTALVKVALPATATAVAGSWAKVTAPVNRKGAAGAVAIEAAPRPAPRSTTAVAAAAGIEGVWTFTAVRKSGVSVGADCTFKLDAGRLTGSCLSVRDGSSPIEGELTGSTVTFRFLQAVRGDRYSWKGELAASGRAMNGTVQVDDEAVDFTATK